MKTERRRDGRRVVDMVEPQNQHHQILEHTDVTGGAGHRHRQVKDGGQQDRGRDRHGDVKGAQYQPQQHRVGEPDHARVQNQRAHGAPITQSLQTGDQLPQNASNDRHASGLEAHDKARHRVIFARGPVCEDHHRHQDGDEEGPNHPRAPA